MLNRGNSRDDVFLKEEDFLAFERIVSEGLEKHDVYFFAFQLMNNLGIWFSSHAGKVK